MSYIDSKMHDTMLLLASTRTTHIPLCLVNTPQIPLRIIKKNVFVSRLKFPTRKEFNSLFSRNNSDKELPIRKKGFRGIFRFPPKIS